jgi:hypothetical protein
MSDTPTEDNPYVNRDHENVALDKSDVHAVAALLGRVSGSLKEIDKQSLSGDSSSKALRIDAKQTLKDMFAGDSVDTTPPAPLPSDVQQTLIPPVTQTVETKQTPTPATNLQQQVKAVNVTDEIDERLSKLEQRVFKKQFKFKRGISYTINTVNIKGTFKDPDDIVDIVHSELAKQVKTITIKLDGTNKNTK